jgi:peptidoglycan/LPS O-acetylase OafA/YrhL
MPLDGVRGLAVLIVVIHYSVWIAETSQLLLMKLTSSILATGWVGVQLFFVLSGFLITGILLDAKGKARYFSSFYFRRMLRIFPRYCIVVALILVVAPRLAWNEAWADAVRQGHRWAHWFYVQNWITSSPGFDALSHTWSLAVEEQFYLVWPLVVWLLGRRGLTWLCGFAMAGTPCISLALRQSGWDPNTAYEFTIARWDALAAGALVAILVRDDAGRGMLHR